MSPHQQFEEFQASELFCSKCRRSQPVREHLLLVLPTGNRYDYRCAECGTSVGERDDGDRSAFTAVRDSARAASGDRR